MAVQAKYETVYRNAQNMLLEQAELIMRTCPFSVAGGSKIQFAINNLRQVSSIADDEFAFAMATGIHATLQDTPAITKQQQIAANLVQTAAKNEHINRLALIDRKIDRKTNRKTDRQADIETIIARFVTSQTEIILRSALEGKSELAVWRDLFEYVWKAMESTLKGPAHLDVQVRVKSTMNSLIEASKKSAKTAKAVLSKAAELLKSGPKKGTEGGGVKT